MTSTPPRPASASDEALRDALVQTSYAVVDAVAAVAAQHALSLTLLRVIAILRDRTPRMSELAAHLGLDRSTITGLVDRAVARGLLRKVGDEEDRRSSRVALTDAGHRLADACVQEVGDALAPLIARLSAAQRGQLTRLLEGLGVVA